MSRLGWLADVARAAGLHVNEVDGWQGRGASTMDPGGVVMHHTAGPSGGGDIPSLGTLVNGRSDLAGPLCHYGLGRSGTVYVVAAGKANHAGSGGWRGLDGNSSVVGIEAENDGRQAWPQVQLDAYVALCAAIIGRLGVSSSMVCGHREWAPDRKPDPHTIDLDRFRADVAAWPPDPDPDPEGDTVTPMRRGDESGDIKAVQYLLNRTYGCDLAGDGVYGVHVERAVDAHIASGVGDGKYIDGVMWGRLLWTAGQRDGRMPAHDNPGHLYPPP